MTGETTDWPDVPAHEYSKGFWLLAYPSERGLPPVVSLIAYVALLALPIVALSLVAHFSHPTHTHSAAAPANSAIPSPLSAGAVEWASFGYVVMATWIMSRVEKRRVTDYGLHGPDKLKRASAGAAWGLLLLSLLVSMLWLSHHLAFSGFATRGLAALGYGLGWAFMFIGVAFFEEFFFRGYLQVVLGRCFASLYGAVYKQGAHRNAFGFWAAAVAISFGFGFVHSHNPGESPIGLLAAGLAGLTFTYSLWRTGSLWWAIGMHAGWDWAQSYLYGVADSGAVSQGRLLASHPAGSTLLSGGLTGPEGSLFVLPVLMLFVVVIATTLAPTRAMFERETLQDSESRTINSASA